MMEWTITATQSDEAWFDDYVLEMLSSTPPALPPNDQKFGHVETHWHQVRPGIAFITANPDTGSADDRRIAESFVVAQLEPHGFKRALWEPDRFEKTATWGDVQADARKLIQSGGVTLLKNGYNTVIGQVASQHEPGESYRTEISRDDPTSRAISGSTCTCGWGQFQNLPRTREFKRFQDRPCKHILATYWQSQATPLDEDRAPGNFGQPGQMAFPGMGGPMSAPSSMPTMQNSTFPPANAWFNTGDQWGGSGQQGPPAGLGGPAGGPGMGAQAPPPESVLPQFPMDPSLQPQVNPASTPGGNPGPTPTNPIQYPGGTFSSVRTAVDQPFQNGQIVELLNDDVGTLEGRSEAHGAGQPFALPKGQVGEVLGTHPPTGMVNVLYMGKPFDQNGPMEPYGATAWHFPSDIKLRPDIKPPGPAIRRR